MTTYYTALKSPIGDLLLVSDGEALTGLYTDRARYARSVEPDWTPDPGPFREAERQLTAYFEGDARPFDLPLAPRGTAFQRGVWDALRTLRFGECVSYGELARRLGRPGAGRAVGHANARNPIGLIVPCHRVVGAGGGLTGYAGGLDRKRWLLQHEARFAALGGADFLIGCGDSGTTGVRRPVVRAARPDVECLGIPTSGRAARTTPLIGPSQAPSETP